MIKYDDYFRGKEHAPEHSKNAKELIAYVNKLLDYLISQGIYGAWIDPDTGTQISGSEGGAGDGGYRLKNATTGAKFSAHKLGMAIDIYDPENILDDAIDNELLEKYWLYREHPSYTIGWCHLATRAPRSGNRTYKPW